MRDNEGTAKNFSLFNAIKKLLLKSRQMPTILSEVDEI
jgi:hypothetical protein